MGAACRLAAAVAIPVALALLVVYYTVPAHVGGAARKPAAAVSGEDESRGGAWRYPQPRFRRSNLYAAAYGEVEAMGTLAAQRAALRTVSR